MNNACNHVALYWQHRASLYRRLNWWRHWEMARYQNQRYFMLCVGALQDERPPAQRYFGLTED